MDDIVYKNHTDLVVIGGSAGSLQVILEMIRHLRSHLDFSILLVIHRKAQAANILPTLLQQYAEQQVIEIEDKTEIEANKIYLVPADYHLLLDSRELMSLDRSERINYSRPSIDITFISAAEVFGENLVAVLLSGANADGVEGLKYIKKKGGRVWIQDPESAEISYMPQQAVNLVDYDLLFSPEDLAGLINHL